MDFYWPHAIVPSQNNSNFNCRCQLTCDDWGTHNTKLKYHQCTSAALFCFHNKQIFDNISCKITHNWWVWIVLFILHCYKTRFSTWCLFLWIRDLGNSGDQTGSHSCGIRWEFGVALLCIWAVCGPVANHCKDHQLQSLKYSWRLSLIKKLNFIQMWPIETCPTHYWNTDTEPATVSARLVLGFVRTWDIHTPIEVEKSHWYVSFHRRRHSGCFLYCLVVSLHYIPDWRASCHTHDTGIMGVNQIMTKDTFHGVSSF